jgi:hypothetical protein
MVFLLANSIGLVTIAQIPSASPNNGVVPAIMNTAGGSYDNPLSYFRFEWSFGEILLINAMAPADSSYLLTHGVLQPCTETVSTPLPAMEFGPGDYKLFPNPTSGMFELDFFIKETGTMRIQLINSIGQVLETRQFSFDGCCRIEHFNIEPYPDGIYLVVPELLLNNTPGGASLIRRTGIKLVKQSNK